MTITLRRAIVASLVIVPNFVAQYAGGADYPVKAIRFIVPFPPGGGTDIGTRIIAMKMSERFGQQVIVDNRGGAAGIIGTEVASKAAPDSANWRSTASFTPAGTTWAY